MRKMRVLAASILIVCIGLGGARADEKDDRIFELEKRLGVVESALQEKNAETPPADAGDLGKRVETIEKKLDEKEAKSADDLRVFWKEGLKLETADKDFSLNINGRIMADSNFFSEDEDLRAAFGDFEDGLEFRRARLDLSGTIYGNGFYAFQLDFAKGSDVAFKDAFIGVKGLPIIDNLRVGHQKEPFSLEEQTSSKYITFMERSLPLVLKPSHNMGIAAYDSICNDRVTWALGVFRETDDVGKIMADDGYAVTGRVTGAPVYKDEGKKVVHLGVAASHREDPGMTVKFSATPELHMAPKLISTGSIMAESRDILGLEAAVVCGPFSVQGEYITTRIDGPSGSADPEFGGYYVSLSYFLTGEHRPYDLKKGTFKRVKPKKNFGKDGCGAWELAARYSCLDMNDAGIMGGELDDVTVGLNWYLNPNMRFMFNYVYADLDGVGKADMFGTRFQVDW